MEEAGLDPDSIREVAVETEAEARSRGFIGSPTVLIDGQDAVETGDRPAALTCRLYRHRDGSPSPLPDSEDLREALARATEKEHR